MNILARLSIIATLLTGGCVTNPATGKRELSLISEAQEIQMGEQAHQQIVQSIGAYNDKKLGDYVEKIGMALAAKSERPELPWSFTVLDDAVVNAFALPGGKIYVTRGLLAHLTSEAQLAGVLGHEIAHVTARHSASQMSKATLTNLGIGIGSILSPELAQLGQIAQQGAGLLFLKFGRDDEREADRFGLNYMSQFNYKPEEIVEVFAVLGAVSDLQGRSGIPGWLQTHPEPAERTELIEKVIAARAPATENTIVRRAEYMSMTEGLVYGENPRNGYFAENTLFHPELRFKMAFPQGWNTINQTHAAGAINSDRTAATSIELVNADTAEAASRDFFSQRGIERGPGGAVKFDGMEGLSHLFQAQSENGSITGQIAYVKYRDRVFQITGYTASPLWSTHKEAINQTIMSFSSLSDPKILALQPMRLQLTKLSRDTSLKNFAKQHSSPVPAPRLALINHVEPDGLLPAGTLARYISGGLPPGNEVLNKEDSTTFSH